MVEPLHRLPVDVGDQVPGPQPGVEGRGPLVHLHHQVVHRVEVRVPEIDSDRPDGEPEPARSTPNNNWGL